MMIGRIRIAGVAVLLAMAAAAPLRAQSPSPSAPADDPDQTPVHDHAAMMAAASRSIGWQWMTDGALFGTFNQESGPRGATEFRSQNWIMFMPHRQIGRGLLTIDTMFSLEPATVGERGYSELFQVGEAYKGLPVIDRQHPHDAFMQIQVGWQQKVGKTVLAFSGGPSGAPALGPVAYMHRPSAAENPTAPISHHTFDSTHVAMGSMTAAVQRGWFTVEASSFHGREPDYKRWNLDLGAFDSWSGRVTVRPHPEWEFQVSRGFLHQPEELERGNQTRTNGSVSWLRQHRGSGYTAVTLMAGRVTRTYSWTAAYVAEATHWMGNTALYGRFEATGVETEHLLFPTVIHIPHPGELVDPLQATTIGAVRRLWKAGGLDVAIGGDVTAYNPPPLLRETHGNRPTAVHVFFRLRPVRSAQSAPMSMALPMRMDSADSMSDMPDMPGMDHHQ